MKFDNVWVFSDNVCRLADVINGAFEFGEKVTAFVIGNKEDIKTAYKYGVCDVVFGKLENLYEDFVDSMADELRGKKGLVLMPNTKRAKMIASAIGAKLNVGVSTEVNEISLNNGVVECKKMVYGGLAVGAECINSDIAIVVVNSGTFEAAGQNDASEVKEVRNLNAKSSGIKCLKKLPKQASSVDLSKAKKIVAVGRGLAKEEDLALVRELCGAIGAELGCTRPIAEGEKWLEHDRYIGISSVMPKPEIYIALGISGQVQHMVGVKDAAKIIAVNKDKNAPIFEYADYGLVGDLYKVVPELIKALK